MQLPTDNVVYRACLSLSWHLRKAGSCIQQLSSIYAKSDIVITSLIYFVFHQQTPSHLAAEKGRFENTLKYLVDIGADINIKDNDGVKIMIALP